MITAVVPARGGSKGIPRKNIVLVGEHPLIAYTIVACKLAKNIDRVVVSTDDKEIAEIAERYGAEVPFIRPSELATDSSNDVGFLGHFFNNIDVEEVALMRPTTPLRDPEFIDETVEIFNQNKHVISGLRSVNETNESPYKVYKIENNICKGFFDDFDGITDYCNMPRQVFPKTYQANGHIDIVKRKTVYENSTFGNKIYARVGEKVIDIDSKFDLDLVRLQVGTENDLLLKHIK